MSVITLNDRTTSPDTPDTGKVKLYMKDSGPHWRTDDGVEHALTEPLFGKNVDLSVFDDYTMTTSGQNWDTYVGFQMPANTSGTYLVFVYCNIRMNSTGSDAWMRLSLNGNTVGKEMKEELKDSSSNESMPRMMIKKVTLSDNDYIDLDFATESTYSTITVREAAVVLWRIA